MRVDPHERARFLMDAALVNGIADADREWLRRHTRVCADCGSYADVSARIVRGFNSFAFETDPAMNARVREMVASHARQLAAAGQHSLPSRPGRWRFVAAALFVLAAMPIYQILNHRQHEANMDRADDLLMERVNARVAREVPAAMEPLMLPTIEGETR